MALLLWLCWLDTEKDIFTKSKFTVEGPISIWIEQLQKIGRFK